MLQGFFPILETLHELKGEPGIKLSAKPHRAKSYETKA